MIGFAFLAGAAAAAATDNPLKTFKDWVVGCDNGRRCMAVAQTPADDVNGFTVAVERGPLPDDAPVIWFRDDGTDYNPSDFDLDGKPMHVQFAKLDENRVRVAPASTAAVLAAFTGTGTLNANAKSEHGGGTISTAGASAALRWMDVAQHRDGTVTALVAKGAKQASAVPPPPALPTVTRRMPAKLPPPDSISAKTADQWREEIFECTDEHPDTQMVESKRLDAKTTLVMITASCASGAYNYLYIPLLVRKGQKPVMAKFEDRDPDSDGEGLLYNLYWKEEDPRVLASYMKGRGLGDCGGGTDWVWDGTMFRIVAESMMDDCRGAPGWITYYRARIIDK